MFNFIPSLFGGQMNDGYGMQFPQQMVFEETYRAYSMAFAGKPDLEYGDKILMPASALDMLSRMSVQYPMLFKVTAPRHGKSTHCGVMEFSAEEGRIYIPHWMMQGMLLEEGGMVTVRNVQLPKGTFAKFRPHSKDFLELGNHRAILERRLRGHSCLTKGDVVMFRHADRNFYMDVVDTKPAGAVSIIETDLTVDFDAPLDYVEPVRHTPTASPAAAVSGSGATSGPAALTFGRSGAPSSPDAMVIDDDDDDVSPHVGSSRQGAGGKGVAASPVPNGTPGSGSRTPAFTGEGRRLDAPALSIGSPMLSSGGALSFGGSGTASPGTPGTVSSGGVVLSSAARPGSAARPRTANRFEQKRREQAFAGAGFSLK